MEPCPVVGVDVGGTFIDYVAVDATGGVRTHKHLSRPADLAAAFLEGLREAAPAGTQRLVHGTTVATNALLERRGAKTGLLTTSGFRDVLAIGRQNRPSLYALACERDAPLVPEELRLEAEERTSFEGEVLTPLDELSVQAAADAFAAAGVEAVAVSFLHSFVRPEHERRAGALLRERLGDAFVCISSDILREYREFERTSTTVASAYVAPLLDRYLAEVASDLEVDFQVMQSNGGVINADEGARYGAALVLSGPAAGVVGAFNAATRAGFTDVLTFDMGGTSTDASVCPGAILTTFETTVAGVPIQLPMVDIHTVGAGGGSIAQLDAGGVLRVGPESAGANPGPACYGRGMLPTVTDADVVLGRIPTSSFLGGALPLDRERAEVAIRALAERLGLGIEETALGALRVVHASMQRAVRRVSVERGFDPREFVLVAFGGAGPLHAAELAEELKIARCLIPRFPGVASAMGMAAAPEIRTYSQTVRRQLRRPFDSEHVLALWEPLETRAGPFEGAELSRSAELRYVGQSSHIDVPADDVARLLEAFETAHERLYGYAEPGREIELVNVRLRATRAQELTLRSDSTSILDKDGERSLTPIRFESGWMDAQLVERRALAVGHEVLGPALITQADTATLVPPSWRALVETFGDLLLERIR